MAMVDDRSIESVWAVEGAVVTSGNSMVDTRRTVVLTARPLKGEEELAFGKQLTKAIMAVLAAKDKTTKGRVK
jgi:hypothetical protein